MIRILTSILHFFVNKDVALFLSFFFLFSGCSKYSDYLYEVVEMSASNADNAGEFPVSVSSDSVQKKSYAIKLEYTMKFKGDSGNSASPHESAYRNEYDLVSFNIRCLNLFDSLHPAGTSLNDCFLVSMGGVYSSGNTVAKISAIGRGRAYSGDIIDTWTSDQYLIMMQEPPANGMYAFVIETLQSNNKYLNDTVTVNLY